jgi:hypothetical protein
MDYNKLYAVEAQLLDKFFANKIPKSLPYSVKRIKDTRLVQVNPKYVCYPIHVPLGVSLADLKRVQADLERIIFDNRSRYGITDEVKVLIQEQPSQIVVARVDPLTLTYASRPRDGKPRFMLLGKSFVGGKSQPEFINLNHPDTCHVLVAGKTGCGKSRMLYQMILSACEHSEPTDLQIALVDIGGKALSAFSKLPHCAAYVTELAETKALLSHFEKQLVGAQDTYTTRTMIVIDEAPALTSTGEKETDNEFARLLKVLAERGRAYGISLVLGAQNPTDSSVPVEVRRNLGVRVAGMCSESAMSEIILDKGNREAADLTLQGTFIVRHSGQSRLTFSYYLTDDEMINEIARLKVEYDPCTQIDLLVGDGDVMLPQDAIKAAVAVLEQFTDENGKLKNGYITPTKKAIADALGRASTTGNVAGKFDRFLDFVVSIYKSGNLVL